MTNWQNLTVTDADGHAVGTLGEIVQHRPAMLATAVIEDGRISEWPGYFLSAPGEEPDWDTPRGPVNWAGCDEAMRAIA